MKTYSDAVQGDRTSVFSSETLKNAVKSAVQDEDRSKNLMVFGLSKEKSEDLAGRVEEVFECLETMPVMDCVEWESLLQQSSSPSKDQLLQC